MGQTSHSIAMPVEQVWQKSKFLLPIVAVTIHQ
jgi:hypothetical protein